MKQSHGYWYRLSVCWRRHPNIFSLSALILKDFFLTKDELTMRFSTVERKLTTFRRVLVVRPRLQAAVVNRAYYFYRPSGIF